MASDNNAGRQRSTAAAVNNTDQREEGEVRGGRRLLLGFPPLYPMVDIRRPISLVASLKFFVKLLK